MNIIRLKSVKSKVKQQLQMGTNLSSLQELYQRKERTKIAKGTHKYIVIQVAGIGGKLLFIRSKPYAEYHADILEKFKAKLRKFKLKGQPLLEECVVDCLGGGRISYDGTNMEIYGHSKAFGQAEHKEVKKFIIEDLKLKPENIEVNYGGY